MTKKRKKQPIPDARPLDVPASDYQPSTAELREETDMPKLTPKQVRQAFFRPFRLTGGKAK